MKKILIFISACFVMASCSSTKNTNSANPAFPAVDQGGKTAVVAHRGFWNCEAAGFSENSIASLKAAQDNGFWGSECDIQLTKDDVVIVNHNGDIDGLKIADHTWDELKSHLLPNGERRPTLDEYLDQTAKCKKTRLVIEFKKQGSPEREDLLVEKTFAALKAHKLYNPQRVLFISFSQHVCEVVAAKHPKFINQFLTSSKKDDKIPTNYSKLGINGIDYEYPLFLAHPEWVKLAHDNGMSVNAWTVNEAKDIQAMIDLGVDAITTNFPLLVREMLGDKECRN